LFGVATVARAAGVGPPPALEDFFAGTRLDAASISPDGRYLALIIRQDGRRFVAVRDRQSGKSVRHVAEARAEDGAPRWCRWANPTRLLCSFYGLGSEKGHNFAVTKLVGVNADGTDLAVLGSRRGGMGTLQLEDRILDWTPDDPRSVLLELDQGDSALSATHATAATGEFPDGYPEVYDLDVYTGDLKRVMRDRPPIQHFVTDGRGAVRLGTGYAEDEVVQFGRVLGQDGWKELHRAKASDDDADAMEPVTVVPGTNLAYLTGQHEGRNAIWQVDLTDEKPPELLFSHPQVDIDGAIFTADGRFLGVTYDAERPGAYYTDPRAASAYAATVKALPGRAIRIVDSTPDGRVFLLRAESDIEPPYFLVLDAKPEGASLEVIGRSAPGLLGKSLAQMLHIVFTARDGVKVPGYLTLPTAGAAPGKPPLVVLPHGGPASRDSWGYDTWVQFLASRGYAVLQVEFRGSSGYGHAWLRAGFRDWGGLPYDDVIDGTKWALSQGYADASRVCIVGGSYGGYLAELAATRNQNHVFRCAVSVAGVSDIAELRRDRRFFSRWQIANASVESDARKMHEQSPRLHAADVNVPVLLIHGRRDYTVEVDHTTMMDNALKKSGKPHEVVLIEEADHYFQEDTQQRQLLESLGAFLARELGPKN
jgi:dienelactone hydrolase